MLYHYTFQQMVNKFSQYLQTSDAHEHQEKYVKERQLVRNIYDEIVEKRKNGEDITDMVLYRLLPHQNFKYAREHNCRVSMWPCIQKDVKQWFEKNGWQKHDDWGEVSAWILDIIKAFLERDKQMIEALITSPYKKGFEAGLISPILFCLDGSLYPINKAIISTINSISKVTGIEEKIDSSLKNYLTNLNIYKKALDSMLVYNIKGVYKFDLFAFWLTSKHLGGDFIELQFAQNQIRTEFKTGIDIEKLSEITYLGVDRLKEIETLLLHKKQIIFYGPSGTGKTFVAMKFAEYFTRDKNSIEIVQFHTNYSYEDFIEGIFPNVSENGIITYQVRKGIFRKCVEEALRDPSRPYLIIIDEINRGNLPKIFGELLFALEYRDRTVTLSYSGERFYIPDNLYIIGTMNTSDRSIAVVDYALRRRFSFIKFMPDEDLLQRWLEKNNPEMVKVAGYLRRVNEEVRKLSEDLVIGHSYFMIEGMDDMLLKYIWDSNIMPPLEEYYFDNTEKVKEFELNTMSQGTVL